MDQNKIKIAKLGGNTAKVAKNDLESKLGKRVISNKNNLDYRYLNNNDKIENK